VGLASKPIIFNGITYVCVNYQSPLEPTNFLIDMAGNVLCKMGSQKSINTSANGVRLVPASHHGSRTASKLLGLSTPGASPGY
jgi:hypothetical protein